MSALRKFAPALPLLLVVVLLVGPSFGLIGAVAARDIMLVATLALMVSGLNLVLGYAGELAVGQVAFYAIGAYIAGFVGMSLGQTDLLIGLAAVIIGAVIVGLVTGVPSLRLSGWPLAMVTFFLVLIVPNLIEIFSRWTGGSQGMAVERATFFGSELGAYGYYIVVVVVTAVWFLVVRNIILSPHGTGFLVLRQSPELAGALGMSVYRTKLKVYVLGTIAPALGGALFAWMDGFIAPDSFTFGLAITLLAASVFGGGTSIYGALLGAAVLHFTEDALTGFNQYQLIVFGLLLVVLAIALPDGVVGLLRRWLARYLPTPGRTTGDHSHTGEALQLDGLRGEPVVVENLGMIGVWKVRITPARATASTLIVLSVLALSPWPRCTAPVSGRRKPLIMLSTVVLPEPLVPIRAVISPGRAVKLTPRTAWLPPKDLSSCSTTTGWPRRPSSSRASPVWVCAPAVRPGAGR